METVRDRGNMSTTGSSHHNQLKEKIGSKLDEKYNFRNLNLFWTLFKIKLLKSNPDDWVNKNKKNKNKWIKLIVLKLKSTFCPFLCQNKNAFYRK